MNRSWIAVAAAAVCLVFPAAASAQTPPTDPTGGASAGASAQALVAAPPTGRPARPDPYAGKKKILFIGDTLTGNQVAHDSVYHAMAMLEQAARRENIAVFIRTDWNNITNDTVWGEGDYAETGPRPSQGRNLSFFDAIVFYTNGDTRLSDAQKEDFLEFIRSGKGFIGIHTATATGVYWPEYGAMIGGYFDNHPWGVTEAPLILERPDFPGLSGFVANPLVRDEFYQMTGAPYSREDTDVLARLDTSNLDLTNPQVHRTDGDFPQVWIRNFGEGRVFYSALGHPDAAWDDPRVQTLYVEAMKWVTGLTDYPVRPHLLSSGAVD